MGRKIYLGIIYSITIICVLFGACFHIFNFMENTIFNNLFGRFSRSGSQIQNQEDLETFTDINLDMSVMSVTIMEGNSYSISYNCPEKFVPIYEIKDNTLFVTQKNDLSWTFGNSKKCSMTITVPSKTTPDLIAQLDVGDLNIKDINLSNLDVAADVGNIEITDVACTSFDVKADVGDITLTDITMENCMIEANVGDVDVDHCVFTSLDIQADLGDVDVSDIPASQGDYRIDLETDLGEVSINDKNYKREYFAEASSDASGDSKLIIYVSTGDVDVSFR